MPVIGIDLGTSNTCAAVVQNGVPRVILDEKGRSTLPSVMSLNRKGQFFVGHMAKAQMAVQPEKTIHSVKRLLGQRFDSINVQHLMPFLSYAITCFDDGMTGILLEDHCLTPTEVSAAVLKKVKALAENALGQEITQAVISVPAHFDNFQRQETKKAAEIAGLNVTRLINEPTAAALAYGYGTETTRTIAVYDFGAGTFDISVLEIGEGIYNVLATGGDTFLGGNDFNQAVADWIYDRFKKQTKVDLSRHTLAKQRVIDAAEFAKLELSSNETTRIELPGIVPDINPDYAINEQLTRAQLETLCQPLVERSLRICRNVFESAGLKVKDIDEVIMVGGMTRMPLIRNMVREWFHMAPNTNINPDEAVGIGAAIQAMALDSEDEDVVLLLDVIPLTLSIEAAGGVCIPIITKNTKVPHRASRIFTTSRDNQDTVIISIFQGEGSHVDENTRLATFALSGIRPARRMEPRIEVSLRIDVSGILSVTACDLDTKQSQTVQVVDMCIKALEGLEDEEDES